MRTYGIPYEVGDLVRVSSSDQLLKRHSAYPAAKAGNPDAAIELVMDLAPPLPEQANRFGSDVVYVAPHALEAGGENAIPQTLAAYLALAAGARDDVSIVQENRVYHTGEDAMQRLIALSSTAPGQRVARFAEGEPGCSLAEKLPAHLR